jgi:hypothetical protein
MSVSHEIAHTAGHFDPKKFIAEAAPVVITGATIAKCFTIIHQSEMGVRFSAGSPKLKPEYHIELIDRLEKQGIVYDHLAKEERDVEVEKMVKELPEEIASKGVYQIEGRGIKLLKPWEKIVKINVAHHATPLETEDKMVEVWTPDEKKFVVPGDFVWRVRRNGDNPHKALVNINNEKDNKDKNKLKELGQAAASICRNGLGKVLADKKELDLRDFHKERRPKEIADEINSISLEDEDEYGIIIDRVFISQPVPVDAQILANAIKDRKVDTTELAALVAKELNKADKNGLGNLETLAQAA